MAELDDDPYYRPRHPNPSDSEDSEEEPLRVEGGHYVGDAGRYAYDDLYRGRDGYDDVYKSQDRYDYGGAYGGGDLYEGGYGNEDNYAGANGSNDDIDNTYSSRDDYAGAYSNKDSYAATYGRAEQEGIYNRRVDADGADARTYQTQSSEEDEIKEPAERKEIDPGPFRYNKRVFFTALPCLLLMLVMAGETFLLIATLGTMVIILMTQMGEDSSRRCVVVFTLLFIPCHLLLVVTVLPLIWLSVWNLALVALVNMFCILTGAWIIIQFPAFRMEETMLCITIEQLLFLMYPCVCSALVTWVLSIVIPLLMTPFIFLALWFVCLQLYLLPAASSFKSVEAVDEDTNVLQQPMVILIVVTYMLSGPMLHTMIALFSSATGGLLTLTSLAVLLMLASVGVFLTTLLSLRQMCEYLGWSHTLVVRVRWVSGCLATVLCYPVLQELGLTSLFLPWLPVAIAAFAAFGLILAYKFGKVWSLVLMVGLSALLCFWLSSLPWGLTFYFLSVLPMKVFYIFVAFNFIICLLTIFTAWHGPKEIFGFLLLLQSTGMTVCEMALYQSQLYSFIGFHLTGVVAAYTIYRMFVADKLTRATAIIATATHLAKMAVTALGYLDLQGEREGEEVGVVEVSVTDFMTMFFFVTVLVGLFLYETKEEVTPVKAVQDLALLLLSLAVSGQSFLLPVAFHLLQQDPSVADLVGLWYGISGVLVLLYAIQHGESGGPFDQMLKVAGILAGVGAVVMVMQPQFYLSMFAVFQWSEVFSILLVAAILITSVEPTMTQMLVSSAILGVCPGIHTALVLYTDSVTLLHCGILVTMVCILLAFLTTLVKTKEVSDATERIIKLGSVVVLVLLVVLVIVDVVNIETDGNVFALPAWKVATVVTALIAVILKSLAIKLGPRHLPLTKKEDHSLPLIPVIGNTATVAAFLLARTQGAEDGLLYDLWCCAASVILTCLQRDSLLLASLSPGNQATPTLMASLATLVLSSLLRSRLWLFEGLLASFFGICEILSIMASLPVYVVLFGIMWRGEIWSEAAVVFTMPINALIFLFGSSYTSWMLSVAGMACGVSMMMLKLPMLPYNHAGQRR